MDGPPVVQVGPDSESDPGNRRPDRGGVGKVRRGEGGRREGSDLPRGEYTPRDASGRATASANALSLVGNLPSQLLRLQLGDPTGPGGVPPCPAVPAAVVRALSSPGMEAGYAPAAGTDGARDAIARRHSSEFHGAGRDDVIVAGGTSGALELALAALLDEGSVLLGE